jgi:2,3-bisphosphoglycerate-independent phosphoglycerate mutase
MNKVLLIVLDGYGEGKDYKYNAVTRANTPFITSLKKKYPTTKLKTDSEAVGLPKHTMGGSEVGHFTMGAGRVVWQSLEEINRSIRSKKFFSMPALKKAATICRKNNSSFHILGMISNMGVHSHIDHLFALLDFAKKEKLKKVYIHAITDGRDVHERSAKKYIIQIQKKIKKLKLEKTAKLATIIGRFYSMDRDTNWNRTQKAYELMTQGKGIHETNPLRALENEYKRGTKTDYYIKPILLEKDGIIKPKDSVVFFNYRTDRAAQLTQAFAAKTFKKFPTPTRPYFVCFGPYSKEAPVLFPTTIVKNNLSEILSKNKLKQLRIAETEKFAHVTFFFNSQNKKPSKGEKHTLVPSQKVASYAEKPEMSAPKITETLLKELKKHPKSPYDLIVLNFANPDLVGHSGNFTATKKALEVLDKCLKQIILSAKEKGYEIMLTADHGNAEFMMNSDQTPCPSHTLNPVIFILISEKFKKLKKNLKDKGLSTIAPTILKILDVKKPKEMTGNPLI